MISSISIKDFRSIASADIDCNWITSFVGSNDAGKSNVLRALNLFFNGEVDHGERFDFTRDYNQFAPQRVRKAPQIEITVRFRLPDGYIREGLPKEVEWKKVWRRDGEVSRLQERHFVGGENFPPRSKIPPLLDRILYTYVPAIKDKAFFIDLQGRLYDVLASVAEKPLKESAGVFEAQLQEQLKGLLDTIKIGFSAESQMRLPENLREIFESLEIASEEIPLSRRGDGIKIRHIPMMLQFIADKRDELLTRGGVRYTHIWGFEEPENNVEMSSAFKMARELADLIAENDHIQLFITTHSPIFYRIDELHPECAEWITTHFVEKEGHESLLVKRKPEEVDETMGLMPIVAPYISAARKRHDMIQASLKDAHALIARATPTLFVEGESDRRIIEIAWRLFSGKPSSAIKIHSGEGDYGSANAVASRVLAWLLEVRHKSSGDRRPVVALFDRDEAGMRAHAKLNQDISALNLNRVEHAVMFYPTAPRIQRLRSQGFRVPLDLESLYSDATWDIAKKRGWIEKRSDLSGMLSNRLVGQLVNEGLEPFKDLDAADRMHVTMSFTDQGKLKVVQLIENAAEGEQKKHLASSVVLIASLRDQLLRDNASDARAA